MDRKQTRFAWFDHDDNSGRKDDDTTFTHSNDFKIQMIFKALFGTRKRNERKQVKNNNFL